MRCPKELDPIALLLKEGDGYSKKGRCNRYNGCEQRQIRLTDSNEPAPVLKCLAVRAYTRTAGHDLLTIPASMPKLAQLRHLGLPTSGGPPCPRYHVLPVNVRPSIASARQLSKVL